MNPLAGHLRMFAQTLLEHDLGAVTGQEDARPPVRAGQNAGASGRQVGLAAGAAKSEVLVD